MSKLVQIVAKKLRIADPIPGLADAVAGVTADSIGSIVALYADLQCVVDARKPVCTASGKCCHFDAYGHRLYVTTIELAAFVRTVAVAPANPDAGGCPFQVDRLCSAHTARPFGCRIYYCDPTAQIWQQDQYELFHGRIKALHASSGTPYFYVEWRAALASLIGVNALGIDPE